MILMKKINFKEFIYGDLVESLWTGEIFKLIGSIDIKRNTVKAININYDSASVIELRVSDIIKILK